MNKKIVWEKWQDPFEFPEEEYNKIMQNITNSLQEAGADVTDFMLNHPIKQNINPTKIIQTPLGFFPIGEHAKLGKMYNIWNMHTDFDITDEVIHKISQLPGVEGVKPISRYRGKVVIGKIFEEAKVMRSIVATLTLDGTVNTLPTKEDITVTKEEYTARLNLIKRDMIQNTKYWAIYMFPNGELELLKSDTLDHSFADRLTKMTELHENFGGILLSYVQPELNEQ